jgi:electron transfer flavoprotein alpha subunit
MSNILVITEHLDGKLNFATARTLSAALKVRPDAIDFRSQRQ